MWVKMPQTFHHKERERFIIARPQTKLWRKRDEKETRVLCTSYYIAHIYIYIYI